MRAVWSGPMRHHAIDIDADQLGKHHGTLPLLDTAVRISFQRQPEFSASVCLSSGLFRKRTPAPPDISIPLDQLWDVRLRTRLMETSHWAIWHLRNSLSLYFQDQQRSGYSDIMRLEDRLPLSTTTFLLSMKETTGLKQDAVFLDEIIPKSLCVGSWLYFSDWWGSGENWVMYRSRSYL